MKSLILALVLVTISAPAFAELLPEGAPEAADNTLCLRYGPFGGCLNDGQWPGPGPGYGPGYSRPLPPPPMRPIQCIAENYRGMRFDGYGRFPQEAQRNALDNCYGAGSRQCMIRFCR